MSAETGRRACATCEFCSLCFPEREKWGLGRGRCWCWKPRIVTPRPELDRFGWVRTVGDKSDMGGNWTAITTKWPAPLR